MVKGIDHDVVTALFHRLADLAPEERTAILDRECAGHPALRRTVERLLERDAEDSLPYVEVVRDAATTTIGTATTGARIGAYVLREPIGEGGFGVVWRADQEAPIRREVAVKLLRPWIGSEEVLRRFENERQAMAVMEHPNIAQVFDAGTTESGAPYFVMELIRGLPATTYADRHRLSVHERLGLFAHVCRAVQHAHSKGVIHRDLKPGNVLVTEHDGVPVPKIIDFGVARAIGRDGAGAEREPVGTPAYMSPEQVEPEGRDVDARSDVYALGVLLYELLTGSTPIDGATLRSADASEIRRRLEHDAVPSASDRVDASRRASRRSPGAGRERNDAAQVAQARRTTPTALARALRGDLDCVLRKALERDRSRRYETPAALADEIERVLRHEPVLASPPSIIDRSRKFARRHRAATIAAMVVVGVLVVTSVVSAGFALSEANQRRTAEARADGIADLIGRLSTMVYEERQGTEFTLHDTLEVLSAVLEAPLYPDRPRRDAALHRSFGNICYYEAGMHGLGARHFRRARDLYLDAADEDSAALLANLLAHALRAMERFDDAEAAYLEAIEIAKRNGAPVADLAQLYGELGQSQRKAGAVEASLRSLRASIDYTRADSSEPSAELVDRMVDLGRAMTKAKLLDEARRLLEQANDDARSLPRTTLIDPLRALARVEFAEGNRERAGALFREALGIAEAELRPTHVQIVNVLLEIASICRHEDELDEAEAHLQRALEIVRAAPRHDLSNEATVLGRLASVIERTPGREDEAAALRDRAAQLRARVNRSETP